MAAVLLGPAAYHDVAAVVLGAELVELAHGLGDLVLARGLAVGLGAGRDYGQAEDYRLAAALLEPAVVGPRLDPLQEVGVGAQVVGAPDVAGTARGLAGRELRDALARHLVRGGEVARVEGGGGGDEVRGVADGAGVV